MKAENSDLINVSNEALGFSKLDVVDPKRKHRRNTDRIKGKLVVLTHLKALLLFLCRNQFIVSIESIYF